MQYLSDFSKEINHKRRAGFGCALVQTREQQQAEEDLYRAFTDPACSEHHPQKIFLWSCASGLKEMIDGTTSKKIGDNGNDLFDLLSSIEKLLEELEPSVLVLCDTRPFLEDPQNRRMLLERIHYVRNQQHFIVLLQRSDTLEADLVDEIVKIKHPMPNKEQSKKIANDLLSSVGFGLLDGKDLDNLQGLTATGQVNAISLCVIDAKERNNTQIDLKLLRKHKESEISKRPFLKVIEPTISFDGIIGHELFKNWCKLRAIAYTDEAKVDGLPSPRGITLAGPPGTGKTRTCEALASSWGFPLIFFDIGSAMGGLVGESEHNMQEAIDIATSMAPCIFVVDEAERGLGSDGHNDGGVKDHMIQKLLTWLSMKTEDVFIIFTANNTEKLPAALTRKGRLDDCFFMDLPNKEERGPIWEYFLSKKRHKVSSASIKELTERSEGWVGAEIEAAVNAAHFTAFTDNKREILVDDLFVEVVNTVPLSISRSKEINHMREWAINNARPTAMLSDTAQTLISKGRKLM